jgi:hypothetical protein
LPCPDGWKICHVCPISLSPAPLLNWNVNVGRVPVPMDGDTLTALGISAATLASALPDSSYDR